MPIENMPLVRHRTLNDIRKTVRALVVDDSESSLEWIAGVLQVAAQNVEISMAINGLIALNMVSDPSQEFDIVFMDLDMDTMDGRESVMGIRSLPDTRRARIPIVAVSGNAVNYSEEVLLSMGFNGYVRKPIDFKTASAKVERMLRDLTAVEATELKNWKQIYDPE